MQRYGSIGAFHVLGDLIMCFHFKLIKKQSLLLVKVLLSLYSIVEGKNGVN